MDEDGEDEALAGAGQEVVSVAIGVVSEGVSEEGVPVVAAEVSHLEVEEADSGDHENSTRHVVRMLMSRF